MATRSIVRARRRVGTSAMRRRRAFGEERVAQRARLAACCSSCQNSCALEAQGLRRTACVTAAATASTHGCGAGKSRATRRDRVARELEIGFGVRIRRRDVAHALARQLLRDDLPRERERGVERGRPRRSASNSAVPSQLAAHDARAGHDHVQRRLDADRARQPLRAAGARAAGRASLPAARLRAAARGDAIVAAERQLEPAAHAGAVDRGDDRLGARLRRRG